MTDYQLTMVNHVCEMEPIVIWSWSFMVDHGQTMVKTVFDSHGLTDLTVTWP